MKALDTPVLLAILRGDKGVREPLKALHREELATPEVCLLELETIARLDGAPGRERRLAAIDRLRRRLTVLPMNEKATRAASGVLARFHRELSPLQAQILAAVESQGCAALVTAPSFGPPKGALRVPIQIIGGKRPQKS